MEKDLEGYPRWRDSVESRLGTLETKVGTEAELRAAMDEDMGTLSAKFGAQERLIQAIAQTQSEHTAVLRGHTAVLRDHTALLRDHTERLTRLEVGQEQLHTKLDRVHVGVEAIHTLLTGLTAVDSEPEALP
jgi:chromosome segregation ATPase